MKPKNIQFQKFGKLTAVHMTSERRRGCAVWECLCDCGATIYLPARVLVSGNTKSCGCLKVQSLLERATIHRQAGRGRKSAEYIAWCNMRNRCSRKDRPDYHLYGGRGVSVHPEWMTSFDSFFAHVGKRPSHKHSLDRYPDPNGNYEPGNCRWATPKQQRNNQRVPVVLYPWKGADRCVKDIAQMENIGRDALRLRLNWGMAITEAVATAKGRRMLKNRGKD